MTKFNDVRHGDVDFIDCGEEAKELIEANMPQVINGNTYVVALGETTGHRHVLTMEKPDTLSLKELNDGTVLMVLGSKGTITHEEHGPLTIFPGAYIKMIEREFNPLSKEVFQSLD